MIGRVLLAAMLAGLAAGLVMGVIQHVRLTPMILEAETYETAAHDHGTAATTPSADHAAETTWSPAEGIERTVFTTLTAMLTGAGFALALAGVSLLSGVAVTRQNALVWGLSGFLAVSFAPAIGLPPELPGMPAGDVTARQLWWIATIALTGLGLFILAKRRDAGAYAAAAIAILLPHLIGAPQPASHETGVPAGLAASFATTSLGANFVLWALIGIFLALTLPKLEDAKS